MPMDTGTKVAVATLTVGAVAVGGYGLYTLLHKPTSATPAPQTAHIVPVSAVIATAKAGELAHATIVLRNTGGLVGTVGISGITEHPGGKVGHWQTITTPDIAPGASYTAHMQTQFAVNSEYAGTTSRATFTLSNGAAIGASMTVAKLPVTTHPSSGGTTSKPSPTPAPQPVHPGTIPCDQQVFSIADGSTYEACVTHIQADLNETIHAGLTEDGFYGSLTTAAVRKFQSDRGITVDGITGPQTWASLINAVGSGWHPASFGSSSGGGYSVPDEFGIVGTPQVAAGPFTTTFHVPLHNYGHIPGIATVSIRGRSVLSGVEVFTGAYSSPVIQPGVSDTVQFNSPITVAGVIGSVTWTFTVSPPAPTMTTTRTVTI